MIVSRVLVLVLEGQAVLYNLLKVFNQETYILTYFGKHNIIYPIEKPTPQTYWHIHQDGSADVFNNCEKVMQIITFWNIWKTMHF